MYTIMREINITRAFSANLSELIIEPLDEFVALIILFLQFAHYPYIMKFIRNIYIITLIIIGINFELI